MVNSAIKELKDRGGSSLQAIKKYIASNYKVDADKLAPFIRKYLKSSVVGGGLVQTKGKGASGSFRMGGAKTSGAVKKSPKKAKKTAAKPKAAKPASTVKKAAKPKKTPQKSKPKTAAAKKPKPVVKIAAKKTKPAAKKKPAKASPKKKPAAKKGKAKKQCELRSSASHFLNFLESICGEKKSDVLGTG